MAKVRNTSRHFPGLATAAAFFFAYLYLPIIVVVALSFNDNELVTVWEGFTWDWYAQVIGNDDVLQAARNSLVVATFASVIATVAGTLAALAMVTPGSLRQHYGVNGTIALPLLIPEIVTAVATLIFFTTIGLRLGLVTITAAHTVFCIPFAYLPVRARLEGMDPALREASFDLYANERWTFLRITLPLLWPGILSGLLLAFIVSLDNFVITFFVSGAGSTTLPVYIFGMIRTGVTPEVNAVSALLLLVSVILVTLSLVISRKSV